MYTVAIGFAFGVWLLQQCANLLPLSLIWLLVIVLPCLYWFKHFIFRASLAIICGFLWALYSGHMLLSHQLKPSLEGRDLVMVGTVASIPSNNVKRTQFNFDVKFIQQPDGSTRNPKQLPKTLKLNWYGNHSNIYVGDVWQFKVKLKRAHSYMNPGSFDYEAWLFSQHINGLGYIKSGSQVIIPASASNSHINPIKTMGYTIGAIRQNIQLAINNGLHKKSFRGIISALAIGERQDISVDQWTVLRATGTSHLMAISGLHIGLVAGLVFFLVRFIWGYLPWAINLSTGPQAAAVVAVGAAFIYAALAGFGIPTQRALIMIVVVMLGIFLKRKTRASYSLAIALLLVLIIDPLAIISAGFWLSFSAVCAILFAVNRQLKKDKMLVGYGRIQWATLLGLTPLLVIFFQQIPLFSPLANIVAVPWMSMITIPITILGSLLIIPLPSVGEMLLLIAHWSIELLWPLLQWLTSFDMALWRIEAPPLWAYVPATLGIVWLLGPSGLPSRWLGIILLLPLVLGQKPIDLLQHGEAIFTLLDVGQGLSAVVRTRNHTLVFDTGPKFGSNFDTGRAVITPYLRSFGINKIDVLIVSHGDNDHIGGVKSLVQSIPITQIQTSVIDKMPYLNAQMCQRNTGWIWDGVKFTILHPGTDDKRYLRKGNNLSCVLMVETHSAKVLLTGDIEKRVENILIDESHHGGYNLSADVLVVPHHGSTTSSSEAFIDAVRPRYALFPVGYRNRYGFPKPKVVERYLQRNIDIYDTSQYGAITFDLDKPSGVVLSDTYRISARRYWHTEVVASSF